jgi:hypothetical protein
MATLRRRQFSVTKNRLQVLSSERYPVDLPTLNDGSTHRIRVRQRVAGNAAANTHVIELRTRRTQTSFDVAQALPVGQLGESHAQKLVPAGETLKFVVAIVALHAETKILRGKKVHQLREDRFAGIHTPPPAAKFLQDDGGANRNSNRFYSLRSQHVLFQ